MRQATWIAFLLLAVGLLGYEATVDQQDQLSQQEVVVVSPDVTAADGGTGMPEPKP